MQEPDTFWEFVSGQWAKLGEQTLQHLGLTLFSLTIAVIVGVPLGIFIARNRKIAPSVLNITGILQTIPSMALLGFMIPLLGIGPKPAIFALFLYALLPIVRNTYIGITGVDADIKEAASGMGMTPAQSLFKVEIPLAFPVIMGGIRTATTINVGVATLAAYIAAGGLGEFIFGGISLNNTNMILAGAIPAALLAVLLDFLLAQLQKVNLAKVRKMLFAFPVALLVFSLIYAFRTAEDKRLLAGFTPEFMGRQDGFLGLQQKYGFDMRTVVIDDAMMYKALYEKKLDVISGYSTDGRIKAFDLVALTDDKHIFPPYYAAPVVREKILQKYPEVEDALNLLSGRINDSIMTELNYKADYLHQNPEAIAKEFLQSQKLWKAPRQNPKGKIVIGSKIFGEQYILSAMYAMLIKGYTNLDVATKTGLGGTKICFDALTNKQIDLYPEYTGTGFLVLLQPDEKTVNGLIKDKNAVYDFVSKEFRSRYGLKWLKPIGFNNAYVLMMRKKHAEELRVSTISDLLQLNHN
ncbi:hypothetical protein FNO01nite_32660 [Flavobacterium noncentrifugens]|uniref:Osmoprotectant transport system permease protein n=1 Tax=Flavobacterium noncentrifugens TaxID=1128970 RepID=A0A1G8US41_9FLAO|nr:ABC transporter permease/substrate-binding protein [Flavobacterium noncentrifugens]GEP52594.1 hypothetical protein FNO01nite_32660 [Flavobacterium noncentrifugens]SDJ56682.1 osmoprotectant transport system permease protein [Flavobacterium noncentrifugens]